MSSCTTALPCSHKPGPWETKKISACAEPSCFFRQQITSSCIGRAQLRSDAQTSPPLYVRGERVAGLLLIIFMQHAAARPTSHRTSTLCSGIGHHEAQRRRCCRRSRPGTPVAALATPTRRGRRSGRTGRATWPPPHCGLRGARRPAQPAHLHRG